MLLQNSDECGLLHEFIFSGTEINKNRASIEFYFIY